MIAPSLDGLIVSGGALPGNPRKAEAPRERRNPRYMKGIIVESLQRIAANLTQTAETPLFDCEVEMEDLILFIDIAKNQLRYLRLENIPLEDVRAMLVEIGKLPREYMPQGMIDHVEDLIHYEDELNARRF